MPRAEIATHQATYTLDQLHAELTGKLAESKGETARLVQSIAQVEAVLKLLNPSYSLRGISVRRRKPNPYFKRGTVFRSAVDVLRTATQPMTTREIALRMLEAKGVTNPSAATRRTLEGAVQSSLRNHRGGGVATVGEGMPAKWVLKTGD